MALLGDIQIYTEGAFGYPGDEQYNVAAGTTASIVAGTPVTMTTGASSAVSAAATNTPVVGTDYWVGIASTTSNETATLAGKVRVTKMSTQQTYLVSPNTGSNWNTQAKYDALVGARVLLDLTSSTWTILSTNSVNNGLIVMPLDIATNPGKVRFAIRGAVNALS